MEEKSVMMEGLLLVMMAINVETSVGDGVVVKVGAWMGTDGIEITWGRKSPWTDTTIIPGGDVDADDSQDNRR